MIDDDEIEFVRAELCHRLAQMRAIAGDHAEVRRELHSAKGVAQAYGIAGFAAAAHALEDRLVPDLEQAHIIAYLDALERELTAAALAS